MTSDYVKEYVCVCARVCTCVRAHTRTNGTLGRWVADRARPRNPTVSDSFCASVTSLWFPCPWPGAFHRALLFEFLFCALFFNEQRLPGLSVDVYLESCGRNDIGF